MSQLSIFEQSNLSKETFDYGRGEIKKEKSSDYSSQFCDKLMNFLDEMNRDAQETNRKLQEMIDEIQSDWTEDEKLQVNDPKEYARQQGLKNKLENIPIMPATADVIESIKKCKVVGNTLHLPPISEGALENYAQVRQALLNAGAKYKKNSFVFNSDAKPFIDRLTSGESVNIKKEFQFFGTPSNMADYLVELADVKDGDSFLEPEAGQAAIVDAIVRALPMAKIDCFELMPENQDILRKHQNINLIGNDFLLSEPSKGYDKIIANPPFSKNQDIDHIYHMFNWLNEHGCIVSVASKHWQLSNNKKEKTFRAWLEDIGAAIYPIERGRFKESGTMVETCVVVIQKTMP